MDKRLAITIHRVGDVQERVPFGSLARAAKPESVLEIRLGDDMPEPEKIRLTDIFRRIPYCYIEGDQILPKAKWNNFKVFCLGALGGAAAAVMGLLLAGGNCQVRLGGVGNCQVRLVGVENWGFFKNGNKVKKEAQGVGVEKASTSSEKTKKIDFLRMFK